MAKNSSAEPKKPSGRDKERRIALRHVITREREKLHWTISRLAEMANLNEDTVSKIENGDTVTPHRKTCTNVAKALMHEIDYLFPPLDQLIQLASDQSGGVDTSTTSSLAGTYHLYHVTRHPKMKGPFWIHTVIHPRQTRPDFYTVDQTVHGTTQPLKLFIRVRPEELHLYGENKSSSRYDFSARLQTHDGTIWTGMWNGHDWATQPIMAPVALSEQSIPLEDLAENAEQGITRQQLDQLFTHHPLNPEKIYNILNNQLRSD